MVLSTFLKTLNFCSAKKSSHFIGTKIENPAIILEDNVTKWIQLTSIDDLQECMDVFTAQVCVGDFPARYSPQFWLAHSALTAIYSVMCGYVERENDIEIQRQTDGMLFDLWTQLMCAGPGSSHLEMLNIILKNENTYLWKYMQKLQGDNLKQLLTTLRRDFVYEEDVSADHYATLMETHVDKIFKLILSESQIEEGRQTLLDLHMFYLTRMNHVSAHIGPRLSHLCFLICRRHQMENPYVGYSDWVAMRHHLMLMKDILTNDSFTTASEAQYRLPITLEKIFQATIEDNMLNIMFKDFMGLLQVISDHTNSKKCSRLFTVYQSALFESIDFKKGFEETPYWLFEQCIHTMTSICKTVNMETHIDRLIISAQNTCLLNFPKLSTAQVTAWHNLLMNYIVSGRTLLVHQAAVLLNSTILHDNTVLHWKSHVDEGRLLIDIISDLPAEFLQATNSYPVADTVKQMATFLATLITQFSSEDLAGRIRTNIQQCLLKCTENHVPVKAPLAMVCLQSQLPDFKDQTFVRDVLFSVGKVLKDEGCPHCVPEFTDLILQLLTTCLDLIRTKGYVTVDMNSLVSSIIISNISVCNEPELQGHVTKSCDTPADGDHVTPVKPNIPTLQDVLYDEIVIPYIEMHTENGTVRMLDSLVPEVIQAIKDNIEQLGTGHERGVHFLCQLGHICLQLLTSHVTDLVELFLHWECWDLDEVLMLLLEADHGPFLVNVEDMFIQVLVMETAEKHKGLLIVRDLSQTHGKIFGASHVGSLLQTYAEETDASKSLILSIVENISRATPSHVTSYITTLMDDGKFTAASLKERGPILKNMCNLSDDIHNKTTDYLMHFINHKDAGVARAAMKTLFPLIKDNATFIRVYKTKFKALYNSTTDTYMKEVCVKLVPDLWRGSKKRPAGSKTPTKQPVKDSTNSTVPVVRKGTTTVGISNKPVNLPAPVESKSGTVIKVTPRDKQTVKQESVQKDSVSSKLVEAEASSSMDSLRVSKSSVSVEMEQLGEGVIIHEDIGSTATDVGSGRDSQLSSKSQQIYADKTPSISKTPSIAKSSPIAKSPLFDNSTPTGKRMSSMSKTELSPTEEVSTHIAEPQALLMHSKSEQKIEKTKDLRKIEFVSIPDQSLFNSQPHTLPRSSTPAHTLPLSNTSIELEPAERPVNPSLLMDGDKSFGSLSESASIESNVKSPELCLLCSGNQNDMGVVNSLASKLVAAGYDTMVAKARNFSCDSEIDAACGRANMILLCPSAECDAQKLVLWTAEQNMITTIVTLLHKPNQPNQYIHNTSIDGHPDTVFVRLYSKVGEKCLVGTDIPQHKFSELLMRLNYGGLLPNLTDVSTEFKEMWKSGEVNTPRTNTAEVKKQIVTRKHNYMMPNVYISYDWAKQKLVEPLYHHLNEQGFQCWMGAFEMVGSDSLYNKIIQGLQGCRVVVSCVTNLYHASSICQRDVNTAQSLRRPIIPLLLGKPLSSLGNQKLSPGNSGLDLRNDLDKYKSISMEMTPQNVIKLQSRSVKTLINRLNAYIDGTIETDLDTLPDEKTPSVRTPRIRPGSNVIAGDVSENSSSKPYPDSLQTPDSLSPAFIKRKSLPSGVLVDEHGYTVRTQRSKSCILL